MSDDILLTALEYANNGLPVFPLHTPTPTAPNGCSCPDPECDDQGKHPRTRHGFKDATTDTTQIKKWWDMWPDANVGIRTGVEAGIIVLDVDGAHGVDSLEDKKMPTTPTAKTGRGTHYYFKHPGGKVDNFTKKRPGLDLKADGGYVVAPPSLHESGKRYEWIIPPSYGLADPPSWLLELIEEPSVDSTENGRVTESVIPAGVRNKTLTSLGGSMRQRGMTESEIRAALEEVNAGRCQPPLNGGEVAKIAKSVARYEPEDSALAFVKLSGENGKESTPSPDGPAGFCTMADLRRFFGSIQWAWQWWVPIGHITMIAGNTGIGKSWLAAAYIGALTGCMPWPDGTPASEPRRVLLLETESFRGPWAERLEILGIPDELVITPSEDPTFVPDLLRDEKLILQVAREQNCGAMLTDSLSGGHALDENSQEMKQLLGKLAHWGALLSMPITTVHHARKRASHESSKMTLDRVRGSSAITQFCRTVVGLWQPEEGFGKPVRADMIKTNFKPQPSFGFTLSDDGIDFGQAPEEAQEVTAVDRAVEFLQVELREEPQPYGDLLERAEPQGISKNSLYRARRRLGVVTVDGLWSLLHRNE